MNGATTMNKHIKVEIEKKNEPAEVRPARLTVEVPTKREGVVPDEQHCHCCH
jgi:hypothetical protein